jgi:hypothetical protein
MWGIEKREGERLGFGGTPHGTRARLITGLARNRRSFGQPHRAQSLLAFAA